MTEIPSNPVQSCQPMPEPARHTATPWHVGITLYPYCHFYGPTDAAGFSVAVGSCVTAFGKENDEANAAFIVEAVNSHAALKARVEELEAALRFIADGYDNHDVNHVDYRVRVYQVATEALESKP